MKFKVTQCLLVLSDQLFQVYSHGHNSPTVYKLFLCICMCMCVCHSMELGLQHRVEYLSRAAVCAKSSTSHVLAAGDGEFLHELEDKMEASLNTICVNFYSVALLLDNDIPILRYIYVNVAICS